jgi:short subunit dehydrogenase-like uncharacterized protein
MPKPWMIYGANGYTGELIAREAVRRDLNPVLAGRSVAKVEQLASSLGLQARIFDLENPTATTRCVERMGLVLNCAGPFSETAAPMMTVCLAAHVHYLDITGEIGVFEHSRTLDAAARAEGIVICPGVGFDVIPTDCVAATLKAPSPMPHILRWGSIHARASRPERRRPRSKVSPKAARCARMGISSRCR